MNSPNCRAFRCHCCIFRDECDGIPRDAVKKIEVKNVS